jgi:hypothetical protein
MIFDIKKSSLQNTQTKNVPSLPSTRPAIQLEVKFRLTISQEQFLQADDGSIDNILLFWTTEHFLHVCAAASSLAKGYDPLYSVKMSRADRNPWLGKMVLQRHIQMFDQIFTIHVLIGDAMYLLLFSLLPKRHTATYKRFFTLLNNIASRHNFNFLPEKLVLTSSVHLAMQLQTHFKRTKKYREIDERSTTLKTLSMVTQLRIC